MGVRSSGYNTKVRACDVQEWSLWGPSHDNDYSNGDNNGDDGYSDSGGLRRSENNEWRTFKSIGNLYS